MVLDIETLKWFREKLNESDITIGDLKSDVESEMVDEMKKEIEFSKEQLKDLADQKSRLVKRYRNQEFDSDEFLKRSRSIAKSVLNHEKTIEDLSFELQHLDAL